jgi:predicted enzyme related to lactoylglutathione lyase
MATGVQTQIGRFVWHECNTTDIEKSKSFYTELFGWELEVFKPGEIDYPMISVGGATHGGFGALEPGSGTPAHWLGVVWVESVDATVDKTTVMTELGKTENVVVTISSMDGFTGPVSVTPSIMDGATAVTGWTVTPTPASVDLSAGGTATVTLAVMIPTDSMALAPQLKVDLGGSAPMSVTSNFNVAQKLTINIGAGTGTGSPHTGLPLNKPINIRAGTMVTFHNGDTIQHVIHASGGIDHENTALGMPGTDYSVTPTADATWYCHNHEGTGQGRIINRL